MVNDPDILSESNANFICRTNGVIIINKVDNFRNSQNKKIEGNWNKFSEPYLLRKKRPS